MSDVIDTSQETRAAVLAEYHRAAGEYDRAVARVAAGGSDEDRAVMEWLRVALYDAERAALRVV